MRIAIYDKDKNFLKTLEEFIYKFTQKIHLECNIELFCDKESFLSSLDVNIDTAYFIRIEQVPDFIVIKELLEKEPSALFNIISKNSKFVFISFKYHPFSFIRFNYYKEEIPKMLVDIKKINDSKNSVWTFTSSSKTVSVDIFDVMYVEAVKNDIYLILKDDRIKIRKTISQREEIWQNYGFIRVHMSFMVNFNHVQSFDHKTVILKDGTEIPISRSRYQSFVKIFEEYSIIDK